MVLPLLLAGLALVGIAYGWLPRLQGARRG
jgi:DHA1 family bicyclomycin/chloramphenicol resistance-like MFS transporter